MVDLFAEGKFKPAIVGGKVADMEDIDGTISEDQLVGSLDHHNDVGRPTTDPTRAGQLSVDNEGKLYVSGDRLVEHEGNPPSITRLGIGDRTGQRTWARWKGSHVYGTGSANSDGDFFWETTQQEFRQRRGSDTITHTWEEIVQYIADNSLGFPTGIDEDTIYLGNQHTHAQAARVASEYPDFDLAANDYVYLGHNDSGAFTTLWIITGFTAGTVVYRDELFWRDAPLTRDEIQAMLSVISTYDVQEATSTSYSSSAHRLAATVARHLEDGKVLTFVVPSTIDDDETNLTFRTYDGITNSSQHFLLDRNGDNVTARDLTAGQTLIVEQDPINFVILTSLGEAVEAMAGRGEPPEATDELVGQRYLDLISKVLYGCFNDPHRTSESTGDFDDINRSDIEINLNDILEDIPVVENEWLYRIASNRFYAGTDVGASQLAWVDDTADNALAGSLVTSTDEVVWLGRHIDNGEALRGLTAIETGKEYFFYREQDGDIVRLDNSSFTAAGSTVAHPYWEPIKADEREEHHFDARDGLPTLANDGSDDNRVGITNDGIYIVDVDPINSTDPTADSWADYTETDYRGAFASDPTIDTGEWYANYVRQTFREFESSNFGLGWVPHDPPAAFIGWYRSRQDALNHAAARGVASGGDFTAFTGADADPKVETATNFTPATSARIQRNWVFIPVDGSARKADTDLQNIDSDMTGDEQEVVQDRIGAVRRVTRDVDGNWPVMTVDDVNKVIGIDDDKVYVVHSYPHITIADDTLFADVEIDGTDPQFPNIYGAYNQGDSTAGVIPEGGLIYAIDTDRWLAKGAGADQYVVANAPTGWVGAFSAHGAALRSGQIDSIAQGDTPTQFIYTPYYGKLEKVTAYGTHTIHSTTYGMGLAEAGAGNTLLAVIGEYEIAADGSRSAAAHRWVGNFYEVKHDCRLAEISMDVKPTGASRYDLWYWKLTRNGDEDYERDGDGMSHGFAEVSAADHTLTHELATPWKLSVGDYIWVGLRSNQSNAHASVVHDASEVETTDLLDFIGWTQADDTGGSSDALTGNLWHSNSQDSAFHARFELEYDVTAHVFIEKDGFVVNSSDRLVLDFRGDNITVGKADGGAKTTIEVSEPAATTVDYAAGHWEQQLHADNIIVNDHRNWNHGDQTPDYTWPTIEDGEWWRVYVGYIGTTAGKRYPVHDFRGNEINLISEGVHNTAHTDAMQLRLLFGTPAGGESGATDVELILGKTATRDLLISASADGNTGNNAYDFREIRIYKWIEGSLTIDGQVTTAQQLALDEKADLDLGNIVLDEDERTAARTELGLGTAAEVDTGTGNGNVPLLNSSGELDSARLGSGDTVGDVLTRTATGQEFATPEAITGGVTHIESGATYNNNVITVSTEGTVRGGDGILFAVPTPFGTSATQAVSLEIDGQASSTHPLRDRNGDALHEADLTADSLYIAISDADSWDILVLPSGSGDGITEAEGDARYALEANNLSDLDSASSARTNLGLGTAATRDTGTWD